MGNVVFSLKNSDFTQKFCFPLLLIFTIFKYNMNKQLFF